MKSIKIMWSVIFGHHNGHLVLSFVNGSIFFQIKSEEMIEHINTVIEFDKYFSYKMKFDWQFKISH